MADLSNVINVSLLPEGKAVAEDNMNVVSIITGSQEVLSSATRYKLYSSAGDVSTDFGAASEEAAFANVFFGTKPNPVTAGGILVMGYWRESSEDVAATAGKLTGGALANIISAAQQISDGSALVDVDAATETLVDMDFQSVTSLEDIAAVLDAELTGASAAIVGTAIVVTSDTTGATSIVDYFLPHTVGTFIGSLFELTQSAGALKVDGEAADTLTAETKLEALAALKNLVNFKGYVFIDTVDNSDVSGLAAWGQANAVLGYDVFSAALHLTLDVANPVWLVTISGQSNYRMMFSTSGNRKLAASYMARMHTVNFNGTNTALTMNLKELAVPAEDYDQTTISAAKTVGLDLYTFFKQVPKLLTSGANDFTDNPYNLIAFIDSVQVGAFNVLGTTPTKVAQTVDGVNKIVDGVEGVCSRFVRVGVFAPGTWSNPATFGVLEIFELNVLQKGYYVLAGALDEQTTADRQARKSPVIQTAVKNAGAIHSADIIIFFNY